MWHYIFKYGTAIQYISIHQSSKKIWITPKFLCAMRFVPQLLLRLRRTQARDVHLCHFALSIKDEVSRCCSSCVGTGGGNNVRVAMMYRQCRRQKWRRCWGREPEAKGGAWDEGNGLGDRAGKHVKILLLAPEDHSNTKHVAYKFTAEEEKLRVNCTLHQVSLLGFTLHQVLHHVPWQVR